MPLTFSATDLAHRWSCRECDIFRLVSQGHLIYSGRKTNAKFSLEEVERYDAVLWEVKMAALHPKPQPPSPPPPWPVRKKVQYGASVYFARVHDFVKIGWTTCVSLRVKDLSIGSPYPLDVILEIDGGEEVERQVHERFAHLRHKGEWFRYEGDLKEWVEAQCSPL